MNEDEQIEWQRYLDRFFQEKDNERTEKMNRMIEERQSMEELNEE